MGLKIKYAIQPKPEGLAQAFIIGEKFVGSDSVCLILGDNLFYGHGLPEILGQAAKRPKGASVFGYYVRDPERYGVVSFDQNQKAISIEEKPVQPKSNYAVTGLYFYDNRVIEIAKNLKPSPRGELEITDVNKVYLDWGELNVEIMGRGYAWLDTGTHGSLADATVFIKTIEERQGLKVGCVEEIAYRMGYISEKQLREDCIALVKSEYGEYLLRIIEKKY